MLSISFDPMIEIIGCVPQVRLSDHVFSYKLRYILGFGLVEMAISTNPKPKMYRNLYEKTGDHVQVTCQQEQWSSVVQMRHGIISHCAQQTRNVDPVLVQCWASVADDGPTLNQQRTNVPCLLG